MVRDQFFDRDDDVVVQGLSRYQVKQRVYRTRRLHFGGNVHGMVEVAPQSLHTFMDANQLERIIGWADPQLLELLRYRRSLVFIDGTFRCVLLEHRNVEELGQQRTA
ncbi:hypothetical protein GQ600_20802 [Phytophthora cactorum]|nr:hypothetical protein GQ600_26016 [Phytophthora cactorum]KAF1793354.1 hypothetical protein GQ600_20802 [Phytophthora cactorum]